MLTITYGYETFRSLLIPLISSSGAHSRSRAGCSRETGASRDASSAQKACGPVPHDENRLTPRE